MLKTSLFAKLLILAAAALGVIVSLDYNEHANLRRFEFPVLILYAATGMMLMVSATSLLPRSSPMVTRLP